MIDAPVRGIATICAINNPTPTARGVNSAWKVDLVVASTTNTNIAVIIISTIAPDIADTPGAKAFVANPAFIISVLFAIFVTIA